MDTDQRKAVQVHLLIGVHLCSSAVPFFLRVRRQRRSITEAGLLLGLALLQQQVISFHYHRLALF